MGLNEYKAKRNFSVTAEPAGGKLLLKAVKGASRFVIQKHDATRLHYDFRLQMDGVLKSWAVPKGLPWQKGEKHLAVEVEDHPIDYESFEGIIPKGQYGGGTVMVWDQGTYFVLWRRPAEISARWKIASRPARRESEGRMGAHPHAHDRRKATVVASEKRRECAPDCEKTGRRVR